VPWKKILNFVLIAMTSILRLHTKYPQLKSSPVTGLEWPRGFQEVKVSRFHDNGTGWW
jgi:hypothetical protein